MQISAFKQLPQQTAEEVDFTSEENSFKIQGI